MCEGYPLVIAANRDEFFNRSTTPAHFWDDRPNIFAGRDEEARGTWMGVARTGRVAAVTNWTEPNVSGSADLSRGRLVVDFLEDRTGGSEFADAIDGSRYQGFNFIGFDGYELIYFSNRTSERRILKAGVYGLSNTRLGDRWLRVIQGERKLSEEIENPNLKNLIRTLFDPHGVAFQAVPEKYNAPCFILGERYGTRSTTALMLGNTEIAVREQTYGPMGMSQHTVEEHFDIEEC